MIGLDTCLDHSAHQRAIDSHDERLEAHGGEIDELRECVVRLTALQEAHTAWQEHADERISALEAAPAKRWEHVTDYVLTAVVGIAIGMVMTHMGINV